MAKPLVLCLPWFGDVIHPWGSWREDWAQCTHVYFNLWQGRQQLPWQVPSPAVGTSDCWASWHPSHHPRCFGGIALSLGA